MYSKLPIYVQAQVENTLALHLHLYADLLKEGAAKGSTWAEEALTKLRAFYAAAWRDQPIP